MKSKERESQTPDRFEGQEIVILRHLQEGKSITPRRAVAKWDIWRLSSIINRLRNKGHNIETKMIDLGSGFSYGQYSIPRKRKKKMLNS